MPISKHPPRYGHSEGHTDICYDHASGSILTCGTDGDIRIWKGFEDDDPETINVGERAYAIAMKNNNFMTASENNTIQAYTFPEGSPNGIIARFTAPVNHIQFNKSGTKLLSGASDFSVKLVTIEDNSQAVFEGHSAPILSVACDPNEEYIASSSCDGTVKIWSIEDQSWEKSMSILPKCSDVSISKTLCRLSWEPTQGKYLCIPVEKEIQIIERDTWDLLFSLTNDKVTSTVSIAMFSVCGNFVAGAFIDGTISIWDVESRECVDSIKNDKGVGICGLAWNPKNNTQIAYTDVSGQLGFLENVISVKPQKQAPAKTVSNQYADLFDDDDKNDDALLKAATQYDQNVVSIDANDDDDDDIGGAKTRKSNFNGIPDDESLDGMLGNTAAADATKALEPQVKQQIVYEGPKITPLQKPFISGATPAHLTCRFMKWNNIGIVRSYDSDEESSIDVEFHDSSVHHALHVDNQLNYTMADLSAQALLLASEKDDEENLSQLTCLHFGSWDTQKEWNTSMPKGEEIKAVCLGWDWLAVGTDKRLIRTFSIGGVQLGLFAIPGPIVSISGHGNQLMVVYHMGTGVPGDQCLGVKLMHLSGKKRQIITGEMLPLTPKSTLTWLGFSEEGTPVTGDSEGVVRMLSRLMMSWVPIINTKATSKSRSDHYWIVGVNEEQGQLRCIHCKGSTFPPTLPRPSVIVLSFQMAVCDVETEKGLLEEKLLKSRLLSEHHKYVESQGYDVNEMNQSQGVRDMQQVLMKLFALACKSDREYRAVEICEQMQSEHELSLAIKYASRLRRITLAKKLSDLAKRRMEEKIDEEEEEEEELDEEEDTHFSNSFVNRKINQKWKQDTQTSNQDEPMDDDQEDGESDMDGSQQKATPTLKLKTKKDFIPKSLIPSSQERRNPFKSIAKKTPTGVRGTSVFDDLAENKPIKNGKEKNTEGNLISPPKSAKKKSQPTLLSITSKSANAKTTSNEENSEKKPTTAFGLWMEENNRELKEKNPNFTEADITKIAMAKWRALSSEQRKEWTEKLKMQTSKSPPEKSNTENRKRKLTDSNETGAKRSNVEKTDKTEETQGSKTKKPLSTSTNSKLKNFMFNKS